jgi:hypothetical protein
MIETKSLTFNILVNLLRNTEGVPNLGNLKIFLNFLSKNPFFKYLFENKKCHNSIF